MMRRALLTLLFFLLAGAASAEDLAARLQRIANAAVKEDDVVGIVLAIGRQGGQTTSVAAGLADRARGQPMTVDRGFKVASIGKMFMAALTLELADEGVLSLDNKLARFVSKVPNADRVTLRELLDHRSGYDDYIADGFAEAAAAHPAKNWSAQELLAFARPEHLRFAPGSRFDYSNTNYLLLSLALGAATGRTAFEEIRRRFLEPLGLKHTWFGASETVPPDALARGYTNLHGNGEKTDVTVASWALGGAEGGMVSNAADLIAWAEALFGGKVLTPRRLGEMLTFLAPREEDAAPGGGYGLGVERIRVDGIAFYGHAGSAPGYNAMLLYEPKTELAIVVGINNDPADEALPDIIAERVIKSIEASGLVRFPREGSVEP